MSAARDGSRRDGSRRDGSRRDGRSGDGGRRRGGGDRIMVPPAEFQSYYGRPIVRPVPWSRDIAEYLFTGGLAAGSALLAAGGQLTRRTALRRAGRISAVGAVAVSGVLLVKDLGRPERFLNMLRVAKPTSPMSVGTWIFSGFSAMAGVAVAAEAAPLLPPRGVLGLARTVLPPIGSAAGIAAAGLAPALATYTAVLLSDTAHPSWHAVYPELPFVFAGSALASGAAVGLIGAPVAQSGPARRMAVAGAALELVAGHRVEHGHGLLSEPYTTGRPGTLLRAARVLAVAGAVGAIAGRRSRTISALSGLALLGGALATRLGVFEAGLESAKDPKYTVIPQRERLGH